MESKSINYIGVTLILNDLEAYWLKGLVQNPINENESETDKTMRNIFWTALDKEGV